MRIIVTSGYSRSLHAIALIHRLAEEGHEVVAGLEVTTMSVARVRVYVRQLGWRKLLKKVRATSGGRFAGAARVGQEIAPVQEYLDEHRISSSTVRAACHAVDARHIRVSSLNSPDAIQAVRELRTDVIVYSGGGILRRGLLEAPRLGVLNAHGGPLPHFRGMNAGEWSLFHGVSPTVAVHWVNEGVDTGPVLFQRPVPVEAWVDIERGRGVAARVGVEALIDAVQMVAADNAPATPQERADGRQFYVMAPPLLEVLQAWIRQGRTPLKTDEPFSFAGRVSAAARV